jgi:hypothetical protein
MRLKTELSTVRLKLEGHRWTQFLRLIQEIPFRINLLKINSQGTSQHSKQACLFFYATRGNIWDVNASGIYPGFIPDVSRIYPRLI